MQKSQCWSTRPPGWNFIEKEILALMFSCEFCKSFKKTYFVENFETTASAIRRNDNSKWYNKLSIGKFFFDTRGQRVFFWHYVYEALQTANFFCHHCFMLYYPFHFSITLFPSCNFFSTLMETLKDFLSVLLYIWEY